MISVGIWAFEAAATLAHLAMLERIGWVDTLGLSSCLQLVDNTLDDLFDGVMR